MPARVAVPLIASAALLALAPSSALADSATLSVTNTAGQPDPAVGVSRVFTLSGVSSLPSRVFVKYRAPGGAPCAPTAGQDSGEELFGAGVGDYPGTFYEQAVDGAYSFQHAATWVNPGPWMFCYWLASSETTIATPFTQTITFRSPRGTITASISPIAPRTGSQATITITGSSEAARKVFATVRRGSAGCAPTFGSDTGVELVSGEDVDGAFTIKASSSKFDRAGDHVVCLWLASSETDPNPIAGPQRQPFVVGSPKCISARNNVTKYTTRVATTRRAITSARKRSVKRRLKRQLRSQQSALKSYRKRVKKYC